MGWKSLGREAVNKNTKHLEFEARELEKKMLSFQCDPEFYDRVKAYAEGSGLKLSQFCRYALSKEMSR